MSEQGKGSHRRSRLRRAIGALFSTPFAGNMRDAFVAAMVAHEGDGYCTKGCRCGTCSPLCEDCSGLQCLGCNAVNLAGMPARCMTSFVMADWCHRAPRSSWMLAMFGPDPYSGSTTTGTGITFAQAAATIGAWAFHGNNEGRLPNRRGTGHIKCNGKIVNGQPIAIEGYDTAEGVTFRHPFLPDPDVTYCALPPGMTGFQTSAAMKERDVILVNIPPTHHGYVKGQDAYMILSSDGTHVECWYGASLDNDVAVGNDLQTHKRIWTPQGLNGAAIVGGPVHRPADATDPTDGIVVVDSNGLPHHGHFS